MHVITQLYVCNYTNNYTNMELHKSNVDYKEMSS